MQIPFLCQEENLRILFLFEAGGLGGGAFEVGDDVAFWEEEDALGPEGAGGEEAGEGAAGEEAGGAAEGDGLGPGAVAGHDAEAEAPVEEGACGFGARRRRCGG